MADLRNFDPDLVSVTWVLPSGTLDLSQGLIQGPNAIQEAKANEKSSMAVDRQGNAVRNLMRPKHGSLSLTYKAESPTNDVLTGLSLTDDQTRAVVGTILVKDINGTTLMTYTGAHIQNDPDVGFGDTASDRVWVWGYAGRIPKIGGSEAL